MARPVRHVLAASLAVCLLILSGLVYPQTVAHAAHHAHHQATTHATALCAWLCAAGQALEAADVIFGSVASPSIVLPIPQPERHPPSIHSSLSSRGPPAFTTSVSR
jgi:hypothetical protein